MSARPLRRLPKTTRTRPRVAMTSPSQSPDAGALVGGDGDGVEVEHQVGQDRAERRRRPAVRRRARRPRRSPHQAQGALDQRDDGVEGGRDGLQRQDQGDEGGAGDEAVLAAAAGPRRPATAGRRRCRSRRRPSPGTPCPTSSAAARRASVGAHAADAADERTQVGQGVGLDGVVDPHPALGRGRAARPRAAP